MAPIRSALTVMDTLSGKAVRQLTQSTAMVRQGNKYVEQKIASNSDLNQQLTTAGTFSGVGSPMDTLREFGRINRGTPDGRTMRRSGIAPGDPKREVPRANIDQINAGRSIQRSVLRAQANEYGQHVGDIRNQIRAMDSSVAEGKQMPDKLLAQRQQADEALRFNKAQQARANTAILGSYLGQGVDIVRRGPQFIMEGDGLLEKTGRAAALGGAYMGANMGLRALNGGGMTYNNRGERDIMGIPFV